ncbi:MAG TPA: malonic semialdehyde reductase [Propionicimonas sp.]|nr:malonic semialdehyde reductase [Propionicimonas sp.]HRA07833.1 malonic semialdehyde reductase [Propionicimonas sp.]
MTVTSEQNTITADSIFADMHTAYRFTAQPVSDEELARVYELAKFTPTALNSQPLRITFVRTEAAKARLLPLLNPNNRAKSESAPVVAILAADTDFHEHLPVLNPQTAGVRDSLAGNAERRGVMAMNNAWLQAGGFILAVRAAGLDAGPMGGINASAIDAEFFPGSVLRTILVVNIGHVAEDGSFPRNPRLGFDQAVTLA